jgi:hypothetical protein
MKKYNVSDKVTQEFTKYRVYCKNCGHTMLFLPFENKQKKVCSWCGYAVYINDKIEFEDKLKQKMGKLVSKEKKNGE